MPSQAPNASSSASTGLGPRLGSSGAAPSNTTACPLGPSARNASPPTQSTVASYSLGMPDRLARPMVKLFGEELPRAELLRRVGSIDQVAGVRKVRLEDGPEDGVSAVEVRTGGGLSYTVIPSRALDIATAEVDGIPIAWRSGAGE